MSKTVKSKKIENIEPIIEESDDEIELKPQKKQAPQQIIEQVIDQPKPKKKLNLSDEERERRRQSMINARALRQQKVDTKKKLKLNYLHLKKKKHNKK